MSFVVNLRILDGYINLGKANSGPCGPFELTESSQIKKPDRAFMELARRTYTYMAAKC